MGVLQPAVEAAGAAPNPAAMTLEAVPSPRQITICSHGARSRFESSTDQNTSSSSRSPTDNKQSSETAANKDDADSNSWKMGEFSYMCVLPRGFRMLHHS